MMDRAEVDGKTVRLINNRLLVRMDPPPACTDSGLIAYAPNAMEHVNNTGTVLAVGYVNTTKGKVPIRGIEPGERVVCLRFHEEQNERVQAVIGDHYVIIAPSDVMVIYSAEDHTRLRR